MAGEAEKLMDKPAPTPAEIQSEGLAAIAAATDLKSLDNIRVSLLGKNGQVTGLLKGLGALPPEERKQAGQIINEVKQALESALANAQSRLEQAALTEKLQTESIDISLPVRAEPKGSIHPISQVIEEISAIFAEMGFAVAEGPDIEDDFHNFSALNIPADHPARQMHDTFYLKGHEGEERPVLRTHTSPVQIRAMRNNPLPLRVICPGSTYRCDSDQTHTPMFHQVEGLALDKDIHMGHLKGTIIAFLKAFFETDDLPVRFRPSFFPFTEPSAEVDIGCSRKGGSIKIGAGEDWLEVMGCGMVHPNVLKNCNIDPALWQGFAFGLGVERLAMLKYGIPDLRTFFDADIRWLKHYGFNAFDIPAINRGAK
jgi:phenylalanyl-tRNA synthetase alpha chain